MSFVSPWALVGLAALPVLWWLHRRLRRPPVRALPSLMFLLDEHELRSLPRGRRFDAELFLALAAAALLAFAAAGPLLVRGSARRVARVVVAGGAPAATRAAAIQETLDAIRAAADEIIVVAEPTGGDPGGGRPGDATLLAAARVGEASVRYVISDRGPREEVDDVTWIALGAPDAVNQGIVAVSVGGTDREPALFVNVINDGAEPVRLSVHVQGDAASQQVALAVPAGALRPVQIPADPRTRRLAIELRAVGGAPHRDAMPADDRVELVRDAVAVFVDQRLPPKLRARTRAALEASRTTEGIRYVTKPAEARLIVTARGAAARGGDVWTLELEAAPEGAPVERPGRGRDESGRGLLVQDLSTGGVDWVYPAGAHRRDADETVLLARRGANAWPIVLRAGRIVRLVPDPLRGRPAPVDTSFWPLLVDNLLAAVDGGRPSGAGFRAKGLLDADSSRVGRAVRPFDPAGLRSAQPLAGAPPRALRTLLTCAALLCMVLLWMAPQLWRLSAAGRGAKSHDGPALAAGAPR